MAQSTPITITPGLAPTPDRAALISVSRARYTTNADLMHLFHTIGLNQRADLD